MKPDGVMTVQFKRGQIMADIRNTSNKGLADIAGQAKSVRTFGGEVRVVVTGGDMFVYYVQKLYQAMAYAHISSTMTEALPFTELEFTDYCYDALHVRVQRALLEPSPLPYSGWALPAPFATMLAALGEVTQEAPYIKIIPAWPVELGWNLNRRRWNDITVRIRSVETSMNVLLVDTIERGPKGRDDLMTLIPDVITDENGVEIPLEDRVNDLVTMAPDQNLSGIKAVYRREPVDAISAATYLVLGLRPEEWVSPTQVHPILRPGYKMDFEVIELVVDRLAQVKSA